VAVPICLRWSTLENVGRTPRYQEPSTGSRSPRLTLLVERFRAQTPYFIWSFEHLSLPAGKGRTCATKVGPGLVAGRRA
jgi:hypothetical protein